MKQSVEVRNDVYNWYRVISSRSFGLLNDQFRACFLPKVQNLTCTLRPINPIDHFWLETLFSTIFMQKIREVTRVPKNFSELPSKRVTSLIFCMNIVENNVPNQKWLFLAEDSEKSGPESIGWPPRFQYGWFLQILTLNGVTKHEWGLMPHEKVFMSHEIGWIPYESGLKQHDN